MGGCLPPGVFLLGSILGSILGTEDGCTFVVGYLPGAEKISWGTFILLRCSLFLCWLLCNMRSRCVTLWCVLALVIAAGVHGDEDAVEYETDAVGESVRYSDATIDRERSALVTLYKGTQGETWGTRHHWLSEHSHCKWYGITCNPEGRVVGIQLAANKLNGTLADTADVFDAWPDLAHLDISLNYLREGLPPSLTACTKLEYLDVGYNYLNMNLRMFSGLTKLSSLTVRWNTLVTGTLHDLRALHLMEKLDFRDNDMSSLTLDGLEAFPQLQVLQIGKSGLKGTIPDVFAGLKHFTTFVAPNNRLEGPLPPSLVQLPELTTVDVSNNMLFGSLETFRSPQLEQLLVGNNNFTSMNIVFSQFPRLTTIDISGNKVGGKLPLDLYRLENLKVFKAQNCDLEGFLPIPPNSLTKLEELILFNNRLKGSLPATALQTMKNLRILDLSNNRFHGPLPDPLTKSIETIDLSRNFLSGEIPESYKHLHNLEVARFEMNKLSGVVPSIFRRMHSLELFSVHDNELTGFQKGFSSGKQTWPKGLDGRSSSKDGLIVLYNNNFDEAVVEAQTKDDHRLFKTCGTMNDFFVAVLRNAGWLSTTGDHFHAAYGQCYAKQDARGLLPLQRASRFPDVDQLSDKGLLTLNIAHMRQYFPDEYAFYPQSFNVPAQMEQFKAEFAKSKNKLWLVKPRARCCGEGIRLINDTDVVAGLLDPNIGEWYVQQFVAPPAFIQHKTNHSNYKFVFRLFALVTSFDPLRVYLHREGLIFYTGTPYSVDDQTAKRSYISNYFFTDAQTEMYEFVSEYFDHLRETKTFDPDIIWERIKSVVVKSLLSANKRVMTMERQSTIPGTVYEIYGYDIVLDDEYYPYLCEINETPNMGLEVNYHPDYHGKGAEMEKADAVYKMKLMEDTLAIADVEPRYEVTDRESIFNQVKKLAAPSLCEESAMEQLDINVMHPCLTHMDIATVARLESELRRRETMTDMDMVYPCLTCAEYFPIVRFQEETRGNYLVVWWSRSRPGGSSEEKKFDHETWESFVTNEVLKDRS